MLPRLAPPAVLVVAALLLTGCAAPGTPPESRPTATGSRTPTIPALATPGPRAEEVTRSTVDAGRVQDPAGAMPADGALAVDVACAGGDGSAMRWRLVAGDGAPLGLSGSADCSGPPTTQWLGVTAAERPDRVRVRLQPGPGVVAGWAVVRRGTP